MANDIIKSLVPLACRKDNILIRLVAELLGLFCTIGKRVVSTVFQSISPRQCAHFMVKEVSVGLF